MLLKYRIIFYAIILCLFGLTLMTVSPVFAQQGSGDSIFLNSGKNGTGTSGGFFLCGTMDVPGWSAELTKDQYEECIKAVKAGENDSRLRGEPLLMKHRVLCPLYFPDLCQRLELKKQDPNSIFYEKNYMHVYKLLDRQTHEDRLALRKQDPDSFFVYYMYQWIGEPIINYSTYSGSDGEGQQLFYVYSNFIGDTLTIYGYINADTVDSVFVIVE